MSLSEGVKSDDGKLRLDLWSYDAIEEVTKVHAFGAKKYEDYNWAKGLKYHRVFGACLRHVWSWWRGERNDPESGFHHLAHAMCCLMYLLHYEMNRRKYREFDDRPKGIYGRRRVSG